MRRECAGPTATGPAGRVDARPIARSMRREPEPFRWCGRALVFRVGAPRTKGCVMSKILITSALPYINGVKHLGNLVGSLLPADVHARFRRQVGDEVLFICGTDEHGTPAELGAIEAGEDVRHYCDAQHAIQADIYRRFGLSFG